jgi:hypothetical protein
MVLSKINKLLVEQQSFDIPMIKREKSKKLNPNTNRMKTSRKTMFHTTNTSPEDRTFKNLPRYANDKPKVKFQDWLLIKSEKVNSNHQVNSIGKSDADGKWYGWSHRAVYGFKAGDVVKSDSIGNETGKEFTIKNDAQAKDIASAFAKEVS